MKKDFRIVMMALTLGICMSATTFAIGEGEELVEMEQEVFAAVETVEEPMPIVEEEPWAEEIVEEETEVFCEAPIEQSEPLAAAKENEIISEAPALVAIEDMETPLGLFDAEDGFTGTAQVLRKGEGALHYGDPVTLTAQVSNANCPYSIRWEVNCQDNMGWRTIADANGQDLSFVLTRDNVDYEYRVVLVTAA